MNKTEFLSALRQGIKNFKQPDTEKEVILYYGELIDDKVSNENMTEQEAVNSLGNIDEIIKNIKVDMIKDNKISGMKAVTILLGVLSAPVLLPISICVLAMYIVVFACYIAFVVAFAAASIGGLVWGFVYLFSGLAVNQSLVMMGAGVITFAICGILSYLLAIYGYKLINLMTIKLVKSLSKKLNKGKEE